ncbi:MAG: hypothetical protein KatS3mg001_422 [Candidatus Pacearchaeota archaeon]|nr:MAG: hypothetical protein KatS3mg001_422 [Candidatus Pacearchaeota archaeon]
MVLKKLKKMFSGSSVGAGEEYIEIDLGQEEKESKVFVKLYTLKDYEDTNQIINDIREGYTIGIIDIKTLRQKDSMELKRAISKIKKTVDALEGNIVGFGENIVVATPPFAKIHAEAPKPKEKKPEFEEY